MSTVARADVDVVTAVIAHAHDAIGSLHQQSPRLLAWADRVHHALGHGGLVMAAGNGGSATHADHLVGELVGRFRRERLPQRAVSLVADHGTLTAVGNDYGFEEVFARQVRGLARPCDVLILLSTSGRSRNLLRAAEEAGALGATVLALTGPAPNPLAAAAFDALCVDAPDTASIQDAHHVAVHALCAALDELIPTTAEVNP
jgi:D-sedoheptulose 7-phosphate isomerase